MYIHIYNTDNAYEQILYSWQTVPNYSMIMIRMLAEWNITRPKRPADGDLATSLAGEPMEGTDGT